MEVIAPFIKIDAFADLIDGVSQDTFIRCVTRWRPQEIATGVSDPEIYALLEKRGNYSVSLVDNLHAKLYIAGSDCLVGSANVTRKGLAGDAKEGNIEVLVSTNIDDPGVVSVLADIARNERLASATLAEAARIHANTLPKVPQEDRELPWFPRSRRPEAAFRLYSRTEQEYLTGADRLVLRDVARANLAPGLSERQFNQEIRVALQNIPLVAAFVSGEGDSTLTLEDAVGQIVPFAGKEFTERDLWQSLVLWMEHFYADQVMRQEISEVALRRAAVLR